MALLILHRDSNVVLRLSSTQPPHLAPGERVFRVRDDLDLAGGPWLFEKGQLRAISVDAAIALGWSPE